MTWGGGHKSRRWLECSWPLPCFLEALVRCWMQPEAVLFASLFPVCPSFLEVFVLLWGEGGRRLHQHGLCAEASTVSREGLQSCRQPGAGHPCWSLPHRFPGFLRSVEKKHFPILSDAFIKKKKKSARETSQYVPAWRLSAMGFPTGRSDLAQYPYCSYILLQIES